VPAGVVPADAAPLTVTVAPEQTGPSTTPQVVYDVDFSESVNGFDPSKIVLGGDIVGGTYTIAGSGADYTISFSGFTSSGTLTVALAADAAQDAAGNESQASNTTGNTFTYFDFSQQGSTVTVVGTQSTDQFSVVVANAVTSSSPSTQVVVSLDGYSQTFQASAADPLTVDYDGLYGSTTASIEGAGAMQANLAPLQSVITGPGFTINLTNTLTTYVYGNSSSTAQLTVGSGFGNTGNFVGTAGYSYTAGVTTEGVWDGNYLGPQGPGHIAITDFVIQSESFDYTDFAVGFGNVYGYAGSDANAVAYLYGGDQAVFAPGYAYLTSGGNTAFADGFSDVAAYASGTLEPAYFYDSVTVASPGPDVTLSQAATGYSFVAAPTEDYASGTYQSAAFFESAMGFVRTYAVAQSSSSIAYLDDPTGADGVLAFADGAAGIGGTTSATAVEGFHLVYANSAAASPLPLYVQQASGDLPTIGTGGSTIAYSDGDSLVQSGFALSRENLDDDQSAIDYVMLLLDAG
jgi:hypothetical protein